MEDRKLLNDIYDFFLHHIRNQIAIIVSSMELIDFEDFDISMIKGDIRYSTFLLDLYDSLMGILLDLYNGKADIYKDEDIDLKDEVLKMCNYYEEVTNFQYSLKLDNSDSLKIKTNRLLFKSLFGVLLTQMIGENNQQIELVLYENGIKMKNGVANLPDFLLKINELLKLKRITLIKKDFLEVVFV